MFQKCPLLPSTDVLVSIPLAQLCAAGETCPLGSPGPGHKSRTVTDNNANSVVASLQQGPCLALDPCSTTNQLWDSGTRDLASLGPCLVICEMGVMVMVSCEN